MHTEFFSRLVQLVEYAEKHELEVPMLALNAALEVIAPSMVSTRIQKAMSVDTGTNARSYHAMTPSRMSPRNLHVIRGGLPSQAHP